jgi:hypothetical protein
VISPDEEPTSPIDRAKVAYGDLRHRLRWERTPISRITHRYVAHHGLTVQAGPFAGMEFPKFAVGRAEILVTQLLGAYERELHPALEALIHDPCPTVVDIGASDGYYAAGLARACPASTVYAYEMNFFPARVCRRLVEHNGVADRVVMRGECRLEDLQAFVPEGQAFVLSDCEGAEQRLMDPDAVPWLRTSRLIVELHDFAAPGIEDTIRARFASSHEIEVVESQRRYIGDYPLLMDVPSVNYMDREVGISEFRPVPIKWALMTPRSA